MSWQSQINGDPLSWLLEADPVNPGIRYFALRDLLGKGRHSPEVIFAQHDVMTSGPVPVILENQHPDGYWETPGSGYYPKYRGTAWQIMFLAQLGADGSDPCIQQAADYILNHTRSEEGGFAVDGKQSGMIHCLQGNLVAALIDLGFYQDERLQEAIKWLAGSITGCGFGKTAKVRYLRSGNSAPGFVCSANNHLPCAWGAVKAMLGLGKIPEKDRTGLIEDAMQAGIDFLLKYDPARADYPMGWAEKPNLSWFKFGYPIAYVSDVLQNLEVLCRLGYSKDPRLEPAIQDLIKKQDENGRWKMEYTYNGKTWVNIEEKGLPSKWVTLRALRVLSRVC